MRSLIFVLVACVFLASCASPDAAVKGGSSPADHSGPAAVRRIVDRSMLIMRIFPQIMNENFNETSLLRPFQYTLLKRAVEKPRQAAHHIYAHHSSKPSIT